MGNKLWSVLFGLVMAGCALGFAVSPWMGWWMPEGVSSHADKVDNLFFVILWITTFFFFLTEGLLVYFMWQYTSTDSKIRPVSTKAEYPGFIKPLTNVLKSQHHVELAWTVVPAVLLLWIAFAQVNTWADIKYESRNRAKDANIARTQIAVSARQFEWRMRYPSSSRFEKWLNDKPGNLGDYDSFGKAAQADDVYVVNELHVWVDHPVVVHLSTRDVIHSFNLPNFRVKQDALPGKLIPVWFIPIKANTKWDGSANPHRYVDGINPTTGKGDRDYIYDIPCAELCGWGHYRMIGRVYVHKDQAEFMDWLKKTEANNQLRTSDR